MKKTLEQKYAVVTGGTSGIGKAMVEVLEKEGYKVAIIAREQAEDIITCDVSNHEQVVAAFAKIATMFPRIDVLVNSAGMGCIGALELVSPEQVESIYKVNVFGTVYCVQEALPLMQRGSKIFNISSMQAISPVPYKSIYSSSKAAVLNLTNVLRMELKNAGIEVCCFCPGYINTNFTKNRIGEVATNERYGNSIKKCIDWQDKNVKMRCSVNVVAKAFKKQIKRKHVKSLVIMPFIYKLVYFSSRFFPSTWFYGVTKMLFIKK